MLANQEILAGITCDDQRFEELVGLFSDYWNQASVLSPEMLDQYLAVYLSHQAIEARISKFELDVESTLGRIQFDNIEREKRRLSKENVFVESYRRTYQEAVAAFATIREEYLAFGKRKVGESELPLRLEIDSFFSFVRDEIATGDAWHSAPIGWNEVRRQDLALAIERWHATPWKHLEETIVEINFPRLNEVFESAQSISRANDDDLFQALLTLHSFHDSLRFNRGGIPGLKKAFLENNEPKKVRESLAYLTHGAGDVVLRMANLIFDSEYKLNKFGKANVQELVGWKNKENLPVVNGRTTKILRHFGFDVRQLSE